MADTPTGMRASTAGFVASTPGVTRKVLRRVQFPNGDAVQLVYLSGSRANATAGAASSAEVAIPATAGVIQISAVGGPIWIRFGNAGMGAAAADINSVLFSEGEKVMPVPVDSNDVPYDYFRVLRAGTVDVLVQLESVASLSTETIF